MGNRKVNIPMCLAFILFVLTLISMHMTSGLYARYTATATGTDSARVAKFDVRADMTGNVDVDCKSTEGGTFTISVQNQSEVAITYDVELVFTESLKDALEDEKLEVTLDNVSGTWNEENKTLTFAGVGTLAPLKNTENPHHILRFLVKDHTFVTSTGTGATIEKALSFTVNIHAQQID